MAVDRSLGPVVGRGTLVAGLACRTALVLVWEELRTVAALAVDSTEMEPAPPDSLHLDWWRGPRH